jgi:YD repeat-containing protein
VLQPKQVTDVNGNLTEFSFAPLGLLKETRVKGQKASEGDQQRPSVRMEYSFLAFAQKKQPIFVRTIRHCYHDTETDIPLPKRNETITTVEYSDGFGRLLQTRTQAEDIAFGDSVFGDAGLPADQTALNQTAVGQARCPTGEERVVVSGWQTYDNKGRVVEKYEPFFSCGWEYASPTTEQLGQKVTMFYDPRGQVIRTVNPGGSEQRVIYGIPVDLANPEPFTPTPWEAYTYDANDNAGRTHPDDPKARQYRHHWNTPSSIVIDALGRTVETVERSGHDTIAPGSAGSFVRAGAAMAPREAGLSTPSFVYWGI